MTPGYRSTRRSPLRSWGGAGTVPIPPPHALRSTLALAGGPGSPVFVPHVDPAEGLVVNNGPVPVCPAILEVAGGRRLEASSRFPGHQIIMTATSSGEAKRDLYK